MTFAKALQYEDSKKIKVSKGVGERVVWQEFDRLSSWAIIVHLYRRHQLGIYETIAGAYTAYFVAHFFNIV